MHWYLFSLTSFSRFSCSQQWYLEWDGRAGKRLAGSIPCRVTAGVTNLHIHEHSSNSVSVLKHNSNEEWRVQEQQTAKEIYRKPLNFLDFQVHLTMGLKRTVTNVHEGTSSSGFIWLWQWWQIEAGLVGKEVFTDTNERGWQPCAKWHGCQLLSLTLYTARLKRCFAIYYFKSIVVQSSCQNE